MNRVLHTYFVLLSLLFFVPLCAQNNTNSPYTRFGYGRLENPTYGRCQGMGGIGMGLRGNTQINPSNPASYSAVDTLTFMFDMGVSASVSRFASAGSFRNSGAGNIDYLALQFSATRWLAFSAGLLPYSSVGYDFSASSYTTAGKDTINYTRQYWGEGGISQVYLGLSFLLWKRLSIGANAYFVWGEITHNRDLNFTSSQYTSPYHTDNLHVRSYNFRYGIQYTEHFAKKHTLTVGLAYENKTRLYGDYETTLISDTDTTTLLYEGRLHMPSFYGAGITYTYDDRLTVGIDYTMHQFSKVGRYIDSIQVIQPLNDRHRLAIGAEYIHNPMGMRYIDRVRWRAGLSGSNSYVSNAINYGFTIGVGLPLRTGKTLLNVSFEYDRLGEKGVGKIREDYFKFSFNATINENWFFKPKIR